MTAQLSVHGRLGGDPRRIETKSAKPMTIASIAVDVGGGDGDSTPEWFGVVAFGGMAERLLEHGRGESISISGRLQRRDYTDRQGNPVTQLQIVVDNIVSARTVRSGSGKQHQRSSASADGHHYRRARKLYGDKPTTNTDEKLFDESKPF